jgi:hypothetical protein
VFPAIGLLAMGATLVGVCGRRDQLPFVLTRVFFFAAFPTLVVMFWPYVIPYSITVANAVASDASLQFIFYGAIVVLLVTLAYTVGVYWVLRGKLRKAETPPELGAIDCLGASVGPKSNGQGRRRGYGGRLGRRWVAQMESFMHRQQYELFVCPCAGFILVCPPKLSAGDPPPQVTKDGLVLKSQTDQRLVYVRPGANFSTYDRVAGLSPGHFLHR